MENRVVDMFIKKYVVNNINPIPTWNLVLSWVSRAAWSSLAYTPQSRSWLQAEMSKVSKRGTRVLISIRQATLGGSLVK